MGVSDQRWLDAQDAERGFWNIGRFELDAFRVVVGPVMEAAAWAAPALPDGDDWLEIGVGPLGVGCSHFLAPGRLHTLDPIPTTPADDWHLPAPAKELVRECQAVTYEAHLGQAERMDFPDASFAVVVLHNMLDHVQDPATVLREVHRVLKPSGLLLLAVDTFSAIGAVKYATLTRRRMRDTILVRAHPHRFSSAGVLRLLGETGLAVVTSDTPGWRRRVAGRSCRVRAIAQRLGANLDQN